MVQKLTYCIDLDGTLCSNTFGEYVQATPVQYAIDQVNLLHSVGHKIKIFTARGSTSDIDWRITTEDQLRSWGVNYDELILGKPEADVYVDDKALNAADWVTVEESQNPSGFEYVHLSLMEASSVMMKNTSSVGKLLQACEVVTHSLIAGNKILWCGNGGSAADSQHLAAELVGRFAKNRPALASIALTTDSSIITALANDFGYETIFERQIMALGNPGDVLIGITTSGSSVNVINAMKLAQEIGLKTIGFSGSEVSRIDSVANISLKAPSENTSHIQEVHITWGQIICGYAENEIFNNAR
jgi:D-sedoheptulose 7-phosphate isomerase